jgi:hypothetical protein
MWLDRLDVSLKTALVTEIWKSKTDSHVSTSENLGIKKNYCKLKDFLSGWKEVIFPFVVCVQGAVNLILY